MYFPSLETIGTFIVAAAVMYVILYLGQVGSFQSNHGYNTRIRVYILRYNTYRHL